MEESFSIGRVAELLDVPAATIRFWEDAGLFSVKKKTNHYRSYTPRDLVQIADVIFLRNSGVPVKQISHLNHCSAEQYQQELRQLELHLDEKRKEYERMYLRTKQQQARIQEVLRLQHAFCQPQEVPFQKIVSFDYREKEKLLQYSNDPSVYVRYFDTQNMSTETRCIIVPPEYSGPDLYWQKEGSGAFLTFLIREQVENNYQSDVLDSLSAVQKQHRTGVLLAQYLFTAEENGQLTDFLKGYVEILDETCFVSK